ncbi:hypothetical protein QBC36DRAFT_330409 [Triangularia setosa]|uniref:Uncharacterized protein n=1 Tax=Triangularia setosa TaxID=2587417 RepID=A0AAN6W6G8_9PEZI|nr:hypothetical protein QBC36DRAFT_330409 [Podospora setosa]
MSPKMLTTLLGLLALGVTVTVTAHQAEFVEQQDAFTFKEDSSMQIDLTPLGPNYWAPAFASGYNATSTGRVKAYNMSQEYPGSPLPDDQSWEYVIKIKESIRTRDQDRSTLFPPSGTWLQVKTPRSHLQPSLSNSSILKIPQHPSWSACAITFVSAGWTQSEPLPGPGCSGFLSQDCVEELRKNLVKAYRNSTDNTFENRVYNQCPLPLPDIMPRRCQPPGGGVAGIGGLLEQQRTVNGFIVHDQINGTYDWLKLAHKGNRTADAYKQAVGQVYVVGHIWGYNGKHASGAPGKFYEEVPEARAEVTCLKAEIVEGGVIDKPDPEKEDEEDNSSNNDGGDGGGGNEDGNGNEGGNGNANSGEDQGNPFRSSAAMSLGLLTDGFCKGALAAVAVSLFSL